VTLGQHATYYQEDLETGHKVKHMIDAGDDLDPGVRLTYYLAERPEGEVTLSIHDADGNEVDSFTDLIPEAKEDRAGLYLTSTPGMNEFQWPMRYASGPKMVGTDFHKPPGGPLAPPGRYSATLSVGDWSMTQEFDLVKDPRVPATDEDFAAQLDLLMRIKSKLGEIVEGVNTCRELKGQLDAWTERLAGHDEIAGAAAELRGRLHAVELELVQPEFTSEGDSLAYRQMLYEKLYTLVPVVASADARPTQQSYDVFDKLAGQADEQLAILADLVDSELAGFNSRLGELDVGFVGV
jgi:hypothetical protein